MPIWMTFGSHTSVECMHNTTTSKLKQGALYIGLLCDCLEYRSDTCRIQGFYSVPEGF